MHNDRLDRTARTARFTWYPGAERFHRVNWTIRSPGTTRVAWQPGTKRLHRIHRLGIHFHWVIRDLCSKSVVIINFFAKRKMIFFNKVARKCYIFSLLYSFATPLFQISYSCYVRFIFHYFFITAFLNSETTVEIFFLLCKFQVLLDRRVWQGHQGFRDQLVPLVQQVSLGQLDPLVPRESLDLRVIRVHQDYKATKDALEEQVPYKLVKLNQSFHIR